MNRKPNFLNVLVSVLVGMTLLLSAAQPNLVSASTEYAGGDGIRTSVHPQTGKLSFLGADPSSPIRVDAAMRSGLSAEGRGLAILDVYGRQFGLKNPQEELRLASTHETDGRGTTKYQQTYQGIPVMAGELIVNTNAQGGLLSINGEVSPDLDISVTPSIDALQAQAVALQEIASAYGLSQNDVTGSEPELWIYDARLMNGEDTTPAHLVWRMEITSENAPLRELVLVNAQSGKISLHFNQIDTAWEGKPTFVDKDEVTSNNIPVVIPGAAFTTSENTLLQISDPSLVRFVSGTGTDNGGANNCTNAANPCATINQAISWSNNGDKIGITTGTYKGIAAEVVRIDRSVILSGGWNATFDQQIGYSIIDGENVRNGIYIDNTLDNTNNVPVSIDRFVVTESSIFGISNSEALTINNSSIHTNDGNGIGHGGGTLTVINSTISGNAESGLYIYSGVVNLKFVTITNNRATYGGGIYKYNGTLNFSHTILANNSSIPGGGQCGLVYDANFNSLGYNIVETTCGSAVEQPTDNFNTNPKLGFFLPSHGYQPLLPDSPAIDSGNDLTCEIKDQRGMPRVDIGSNGTSCDIGAYEYTPPGAAISIWPSLGDHQHAAPGSQFLEALTAVVLDVQGNPVGGVGVTFTAPIGGPGSTFSGSGNTYSTITDVGGAATTPALTANSELGVFQINADAGSGITTAFNLENLAWFVSPSGSNLNTCKSPNDPCATINAAVEKASPGDSIYASVGVYRDTGTQVVSINKSLILSGGWNTAFDDQTGYSTIDGQGLRGGILFSNTSFASSIDQFEVMNSLEEGVYINHSSITVVLSNFMIHHNLGGGIYNSGSLTINNSSIHNNTSTNSGGGIHNAGNLIVRNSFISQNKSYFGGGINTDIHTVVVVNSTISQNEAEMYGGGIWGGTSLSIKNSIVAGNTALEGPDCYGKIISRDYNIIGNTSGCLLNIANAGHDKLDTDPQLTDFLPLLGYAALLPTSPAINSAGIASCPAVDIRRLPRSDGHCDIGSYEYTASGAPDKIWLLGGTNQVTSANTVFQKPLKVVVTDQYGSPVPGITVTFTAPDTGPSGVFGNTLSHITSSVTNSGGLANSAPFTSNNEVGSFLVFASVGDIAEEVNFSLHNGFWTVKSTGNDNNDCLSPSTSCASLQGVLAKANLAPGNEIRVASGTYDLPVDFSISKDVQIRGGWNAGFTAQTGMMEFQEPIVIASGAKVSIDRLLIENYDGFVIHYGFVYNQGDLTLTNSVMRNNKGWGIKNEGVLVVERVSLSKMLRGIHNHGTATVINSTISGNTDLGILNYPGGYISVMNSTIAFNKSTNGGGIRNDGSAFRLANTIVANNTSTIGDSGDCYGIFISDGHNLIGNIGRDLNGNYYYDCRADWSGFDLIGYITHDRVDHKIDPLLSPLTEKPAGSNKWIHPLKLGSVAIDNGNEGTPGGPGYACPATDQLGTSRPQGGSCDIGAVEYKFGAYPTNSLLITYTANHTTVLPGTKVCESNTAICGGSDNQAKTAHKFAYSTYSQYQSWHGRDSLDGKGFQLISVVRFDDRYQNAFWNGHMMVYGDGYGFALADDVVAHELTHGVTQFESNLFYWYQSGAINESFSDLWGEAVDQANGLGNDAASVKWLIGEEIAGLGAIRNMQDPPSFMHPNSITSVFYCKSGDCLKDNGGVHTNSGVNNKAVYLMVDGGQFGGRNVKALGWLKTLSIYYEAQTTLLTSGSDYLDLYNVLYQACLNKVGINNISLVDCTEVRDATLAVKMNAKVTASFAPDVALCPTGTNAVMPGLFYDDFETGVNGWTLGTLFGESAWELSNNNAKSGTSSLWANDIHETSDSYAATKRILLPTGSKPYLHFSHTFNFETDAGVNYDGGVLEYSINNGTTWIDAKPLFSAGRNYTGAIKQDTDNKLAGRAGFVNASHGYVDSRYNLTTLVGKSIQFRWRMGTDTAGNLRGWHVDNVRIYLCVSKPGIPTLMKPLKQSPTNDITPTFAWTDSTPDLHHYELQIAADINFVNVIRRYNNIAMSTFTPTTGLMLDDTYYWRVRAFNAAGKSSAWSEVWEFTIP